MNYGDRRAAPSGNFGGEYPPLPDGAYQAKCVKAEWKEGSKNGVDYALCKCVCEVLSPAAHKGQMTEVMGYARDGDHAALDRLAAMLYDMGYTELQLRYANDVINSDSGPVGMVFEVRVKTSSQGTKFTNFVRRVAERMNEQPTPFDEPTAPADDFPF